MQQKISENFAIKLRKLRAKRNLTQEELAYRADLSTRALQKLEASKPSDTKLTTLNKLANALEITLSELLEEV